VDYTLVCGFQMGETMRESLLESVSDANRKSSADPKEERGKPLWARLCAEFMGTALLMTWLSGCLMADEWTKDANEDCAMQIGVTLGVAVALFGCVSGAHFNPAISVAFAACRPDDFGWGDVLPYSIVQLLGAFVGTGINMTFYSGIVTHFEDSNNIGTHSLGSIGPLAMTWADRTTTGQAFMGEFYGSFMLGFLVFIMTNSKTIKLALPVPFTLGAGLMCIINTLGPVTTCGINPARDLGPRMVALFAGWSLNDAFQDGSWVYTVAPLLGAPMGAAFADFVLPVIYEAY